MIACNTNPDRLCVLGFCLNAILIIPTLIISIFSVVQAQAAKLSAEVLRSSQRPQLAAEAHHDPIKDLLSSTPRVQVELLNVGPTVAFDVTYESWIEIQQSYEDDFTSSADYHHQTQKMVLYPSRAPVVLNIPIRRGLSDVERSEIKALKKYVCIRICVAYRDIFNSNWVANFGIYLVPNGLAFLPRYNDLEEKRG